MTRPSRMCLSVKRKQKDTFDSYSFSNAPFGFVVCTFYDIPSRISCIKGPINYEAIHSTDILYIDLNTVKFFVCDHLGNSDVVLETRAGRSRK